MKLYVIDSISQKKIYLNMAASDRRELGQKIGKLITLDKCIYDVNSVFAEKSVDTIIAGGILGGLIGLLGGPIGLVAGSTIGAMVGSNQESQDEQAAKRFNESYFP